MPRRMQFSSGFLSKEVRERFLKSRNTSDKRETLSLVSGTHSHAEYETWRYCAINCILANITLAFDFDLVFFVLSTFIATGECGWPLLLFES